MWHNKMAVTLRSCAVHMFRRLKLHNGLLYPTILSQQQSSHSASLPSSSSSVVKLPQTSLSSPPWPELPPLDLEEQQQQHAVVVQKVNDILTSQSYGRLFAVVQFAGRQWKVTGEDLILIENHLEAQCGDRIRMEKVLMVGGEDFTLIGRPLLGFNLVRVEATVVEKTESWPRVVQRFTKRKRFERRSWRVQPQTVLRINSIQVAPTLS